MRFGDILRLCRQNLWRRKSRTILTVLGVIVGCCSIVLMVSLGQGINEQNEKMLKSMGDLSIVTVYTNGYAGPMGGGGSSEMGDTKLDDKAVESFRAMSGVSGVTPMMNFPYNVTARAGAGGRYLYDYVQIMGIDMTQFDQMGYKLVGGEKPVKKDQVLAGEWFAYGFMDTLKNGEQRTSTRGGQYSSCTFDQTTGQCEEDQDEDPFFDPLATQISLTTGTNYQGDQYSMNMYGGGGGAGGGLLQGLQPCRYLAGGLQAARRAVHGAVLPLRGAGVCGAVGRALRGPLRPLAGVRLLRGREYVGPVASHGRQCRARVAKSEGAAPKDGPVEETRRAQPARRAHSIRLLSPATPPAPRRAPCTRAAP